MKSQFPQRALVCALIAVFWLLMATAAHVAQRTAWAPESVAISSILNALEFSSSPGRAFTALFAGRRFVHTPAGGGLSLAVNALLIASALFMLASLRTAVRTDSQSRKNLNSPVTTKPGPLVASRRAFLLDSSLMGATAIAAGSGMKAFALDPWTIQIARYRTEIRDLPASLRGIRIAVVSDTHVGPRVSASFVAEAVRRTLELQPDVILLGGDYINQREAPEDVTRLFQPLIESRPAATAGVLGNHDWYGDAPGIRLALSDIGVHMIDNDRIFLGPDLQMNLQPMKDCICIAGLGDLDEDTVNVRTALDGVPPEIPRIVLAHQPDTAEISDLTSVSAPRVDLMISGHTHGGQVRLPFLGTPVVPSRYGQKYAGGLVHGPRFPVVVSRGLGMSILPIRWNVPPEIVEITLA